MNSTKKLDSVIINPQHAATASVIWLHGLGADGYDFANIVPQLNLPESLAVRFIFPHAPQRAITRAQGMRMRAWFDIGDNLAISDEQGIYDAKILIDDLITAEIVAGIPSRHIILAGFSQGGAMALHCGLRYPQSLGGILTLSGFLLLPDDLPQAKHIANNNTPILLMHGEEDDKVPLIFATKTYAYLAQLGLNITMQRYTMAHSVCQEQIQDIGSWLTEVLANAYSE